jgi:hypothetical protein
MQILLGFSPFVAFFVLMRLVSPVAGIGAAFLASLLLCVRMWRRKESVKILEIGSLLLFATLVFYTLVAAPAWTVATVRLAVDGGLLAIVLVSLAIDRPFTLQYAREQVDAQYWSSPLFISTNRLITAVWAAAFAVLVAADAAAEYVDALPLWVDVVGSIVALIGALGFTVWYPRRVRAAAAAAAAASSPD